MVVVLPAPFGPRKPVIFPGSTLNDRLLTAIFSPYRLLSPRTSIITPVLSGSTTWNCYHGPFSLLLLYCRVVKLPSGLRAAGAGR